METFFFKEVLVRTSVRPTEFILEILDKNEESWLGRLKEDAYFMNSVFLASPSLYEKFLQLSEIPKNHKDYLSIKNSLLKYAKRISTRSTPFGLFSGCQVVEIGENNILEIGQLRDFEYHTSLDMETSVRLASQLAKDPRIQNNLIYSPNTSIYQIGLTKRLVSYSFTAHKKRKYQLISINDEVEMNNILKFSRCGKTYNEIKQFLIKQDYSEEEVVLYLNDLIESQVLISELEPSSLGEDFELQIINTLEKILLRCENSSERKNLEEKIKLLKKVVGTYPTYISDVISNPNFLRNKEKEILLLLNQIVHFPETPNLLQIDLQTKFDKGGFPQKLLKKVKYILPIIQKLRRTEPNPTQGRLYEFKKAFTERYDSRAVPLSEVLDVEVGIGYGASLKNNAGDNHPLIDNLPRERHFNSSEDISWNEKIDSFWIENIKTTFKNGGEIIQLNDSDLARFQERSLDYGATFVVKTTLLKKQEDDYLNVEFFGGHTVAGFASTLDLIVSEDLLEDNFSPLLEELKEPLEARMINEFERGNYDLLDGGIGIALYFLKRYQHSESNKKDEIKKVLMNVIDLLSETAVGGKKEKKWKEVSYNFDNDEVFNIGLAHGNASVAAFLSKMYLVKELKTDKLQFLLEGSMNFLLKTMFTDTERSYFPNKIDGRGIPIEPVKSRLGWCYGDLGVTMALWQVSKALDLDRITDFCSEIWTHSANRVSIAETGVNDISLCHGAFGNALIFSHIAKCFPEDLFNRRARFWLDEGVNMVLNHEYYWKIPFPSISGVVNNNLSVIQGLPGAGLTIIKFLSDKTLPFDEYLLLK